MEYLPVIRKQHNQELCDTLSDYFKSEGIVPGYFSCKRDCPPDGGNVMARGMQCHIGELYGESEDYLKLLVVSLDCGGGGASVIDERTRSVYKSCAERADIHMNGKMLNGEHILGTNDCAKQLLGIDDTCIAKYYAMSNACKCCHKNDSKSLPTRFYQKCADIKIQEIEILDPDIILLQSNRNLIMYGFDSKKEVIPDLPEDLKSWLFYYRSDDGKLSYLIRSYHPSARGKSNQYLFDYFTKTFPKIVDYIHQHPIKKCRING